MSFLALTVAPPCPLIEDRAAESGWHLDDMVEPLPHEGSEAQLETERVASS